MTTLCPFKIAIDTREQIPFSFVGMQMPIKGKMTEVYVETIERCLGNDNGDYQIEGIDSVTIERKGLDDYYRSISPNSGKREAFQKQIDWMNFSFRWSMVIIEAGREEVADPSAFDDDWRSQLHPHTAEGTIRSWRQRYPRVHFLMAGGRREAEIETFQHLYHAWRHSKEKTKK